MRTFFYRIFENSNIYTLTQRFFGLGASVMLPKVFDHAFADSKGLILDVGCGPLLTTSLPKGRLIGLDINFEYLRHYPFGKEISAPIKEENSGQHCAVNGSAYELPFKSGVFDECRSFGLLHHLPDSSTISAIKEMVRCVRSGGKVVIIDNVWPHKSYIRPLAWLIRKLDRGKWIRHQATLGQLAEEATGSVLQSRRFTYTSTGLECVVLTFVKQGSK